MSILTVQEMQREMVDGCEKAENSWFTSAVQKRMAATSRRFWTDPANALALDKFFALFQQTTSKETPMTLTAEQTIKLAQALGIDTKAIDWKTLLEKIVAAIAFFLTQLQQTPAKQGAKAAGCPDHDNDHCCQCYTAGVLALEAASVSFDCARECCTP